MPVVEEAQRLDTLRRLGLSEALVRQSSGEPVHPLLAFRCQGPPFYSYHGAACPEGPPLAPLWDCGGSVTGVWVRGGRLEFIEFSIEAHEEYTILAHTEQGLWAAVFVNLYEDRDDLGPDAFGDAARAVGFRYLDRLVTSYGSADVSTFEAPAAFLRNLVGTIDEASAAT
ncbi:MAG TPA: hypothetical protein VL371_07770 [Gemmataceae bacterium]|nr:hypothetical protein [Gemmataceae bacterium]